MTGPYAPKGAGDTPKPPPVVRLPAGRRQKRSAQKEILSTLMRRAYRRPIATADVDGPMAFYREARADGDFDPASQRR